jgi:hypothetical protein
VHDNLVRGDMLAGAWAGETWNTHLWNNVVISRAGQVTAYREPQNPCTGGEPSPHLRTMDYNVYDAPPVYAFGECSSSPTTFDLAGMQAVGFEVDSQVGPDDVAAILDLGRCGPAARPVPF